MTWHLNICVDDCPLENENSLHPVIIIIIIIIVTAAVLLEGLLYESSEALHVGSNSCYPQNIAFLSNWVIKFLGLHKSVIVSSVYTPPGHSTFNRSESDGMIELEAHLVYLMSDHSDCYILMMGYFNSRTCQWMIGIWLIP